VKNNMTTKHQDTKVVGWDPRYRDDFIRLNKAWIEHYFILEATDRKYLYHPEKAIIEPGGDIIFMLRGDRVVGTCALVPCGDGVLELAKMAIVEEERGKGLGNGLIEAVIDKARCMGARKVFLLSNTRMVPAISLYKKYGFRTVRLGPHPDYERADIEMELVL
jgi:N-acetylglutamate synthase-like GNAT family acetyltransferase